MSLGTNLRDKNLMKLKQVSDLNEICVRLNQKKLPFF